MGSAPRPRGGQSLTRPEADGTIARSPPTRGSVEIAAMAGDAIIPLPAHAGVSRCPVLTAADHTAAPRPRGGQSEASDGWWQAQTRSPPTRGSVVRFGVLSSYPLPLPAHAGVSRRPSRL